MITDIKARVDQIPAQVQSEGDMGYPSMSKLGQLFVADWHTRLVLAGRAYTLDLGTVAAAAYTALTGNAAPDLDQPEIVIAVDSGFLIPMEIDIAIAVDDMDAYDDVTDIMFIVDRTAAMAGGTGTPGEVEVPNNLLDGGEAFAGRCVTICAGGITTPVPADVLVYRGWEKAQIGAETAGSGLVSKHLYKKFDIPTLIAGPCQIIGYVTGTNTPTFIGNVKFAHIPASWLATS